MMGHHGAPCWYELATTPGKLSDADDFYRKVLGWTISDAGMQGFTYHLANTGGDMVAGLMEMPPDVSSMPPFWLLYFAVDDADKAVADMQRAGAKIHRPVAEIPGTGRFAILADPQGVGFGILEPILMPDGSGGNAFDQTKEGHGNWHELSSSDPKAAMGFYSRAFGWTNSRTMPMGEMGDYDMVARNGTDIGGMMRQQPGVPVPGYWLPYFGVDGVDKAIERINSAGGRIVHGPHDVPGGAFIAISSDPQGAMFAVAGPK